MGIYKVPEIIKEVYFGKTDSIKEIQDQFSKFRNKFINNTIVFSTKINIDPELLKFNRMIEEEFGFKSFSLYIVNDIYHDANTIPIGLTPGKSMSATKSGFKLKSKNGYTTLVCVSTGLLLDKSFSDEEIFSIILHEIGHNFSQNIDKHTSLFFMLHYIINIIHSIEQAILLVLYPIIFIEKLLSNIFSLPIINRIFIAFGNEYRKKNKKATKTFDFLIGFTGGISALISESNNFGLFFKLMFNNISSADIATRILYDKISKLTPAAILSTFLGYNGEKVSDNFATVYGYGPELGSAITKMKFSNGGSISFKTIEKVPIISNLYSLMMLPAEVILTGFDCHPNTPSRVNQQIIYLQKELEKNDLDPYVKDCIHQDIKKLQSDLEKNMFSSTQNKIKNSIKDPYLTSKIYCTVMYKLFGGDLRDIIYDEDNHKQYEDAYEKYKKE